MNESNNNHETANGTKPVLADSYYWHCTFTFPNDKLECYLTERNNCKTFKELRRWWRKEKPALKLVSAVRQ
jgi:hypothetical protein